MGSKDHQVDARLVDVKVSGNLKKITIYVYDEEREDTSNGSGYVMVIPGKGITDYEVDTSVCYSKKQFREVKKYLKQKPIVIEHELSLDEPTVIDTKIPFDPGVSIDKPVIYLYPEKPTDVKLTLDFAGTLNTTYPLYEDGWKVIAYPDGTLEDANGRKYNYLFWEGVSDMEFDFSKGFCIKGEDTRIFLENALTQMGLSDKEQGDFITYWLPQMQNNKYNLISFQGENYAKMAKIETSCKVDTEIRVFMAWKPSNTEIAIEPQEIKKIVRKGFVLVEWGGSKVD